MDQAIIETEPCMTAREALPCRLPRPDVQAAAVAAMVCDRAEAAR